MTLTRVRVGFFVAMAALLSLLTVETPAAGEGALTTTDLFEAGREGYSAYRIPGLVVTNEGTILAYCEARQESRSDWANIDIMMRRSRDGGNTWDKRQKLVDAGESTANNPVAIVDRQTGDVHFLYCIDYARCFYMSSRDDGKTFSPAVEITDVFKQFQSEYQSTVIATGPGHGIQLAGGRLIVPVWMSDGGGRAHRPSCVSVIYSDDHGKTWHRGQIVVRNSPAFKNPSETLALELADGRVMLNIRNESKEHRRLVSLSDDGVGGWSTPAFDEALYEPICMASLIRLTRHPPRRKNRILFANPDSRANPGAIRSKWGFRSRENLTINMSYDEGKTWPVAKVLDPGISGYSDMAAGPDGSIYCLYERGGEEGFAWKYLTFARFTLPWLSDGKDRLEE